jgi:cell division protein FtsL
MEDEAKILWNRAFDKFDDITEKIDKLCATTQETKLKLDDHLDNEEKKGTRKERVFYVVIAAMASVFSLFTFIRSELN